MQRSPLMGGGTQMRQRLTLGLVLAFAPTMAKAQADDGAPVPVVEQSITVLGSIRLPAQDADATSLLKGTPGYSTYNAGGVSALPVLDGMADDRINTLIDGVRVDAACPNHMNPAMSYIDPDMVEKATATAGITPVSIGGDSIGGTIEIRRKPPQYAADHRTLITGHMAANYASNGSGRGASGDITVANEHLSLRYSGSYRQADNYASGGDQQVVRSTDFLAFNHAVTMGARGPHDELVLTFGQQDIPHEAYPNQYMDMTNNRSTYLNGRWSHVVAGGLLDEAKLELGGHWQRVTHVMNMLDDKGGHSATTGMPMNTDARQAGYTLDLTIPHGRHIWRLGTSFDHDGLNDWWPPLAGSMMMGPGTWHNINGGLRDHEVQYAQWDAQWSRRLSTQLGIRNDNIWMNTGPVSPYARATTVMSPQMMGPSMGVMTMTSPDTAAADSFNAADRRHADVNFDVTATTRYLISEAWSIEGGYARKTRSPNFYERYAWGRSAMTSEMIGWFGDGNGYVGDLRLKPEIANTASVTLQLHDPGSVEPDRQRWRLSVRPFYTYTQDYINVSPVASLGNGASLLQFTNHDAESFGLDIGGHAVLWGGGRYGRASLDSTVSWVRGTDLTNGASLYHQMPPNGVTTFSENYGSFGGHISLTWATGKDQVDWVRQELRTAGYALLGFGLNYRMGPTLLDISIANALDQRYALPLGGRMLDPGAGRRALLAPGRSVNMAVSTAF